MSKISKYEELRGKLIKRLSNLVEQCCEIIDKEYDEEIKDDKLYNVLKSKREAAEMSVWAAKEVDRLTNEENGIAPKEKKSQNWANKMAV